MPKPKKFGPVEAKAWLATLDQTHKETTQLVHCGMWAIRMLHNLRQTVFDEGNVIAFETGKKVPMREMEPWPDLKQRNFEQLGRELDLLCHQLNHLLPDAEKPSCNTPPSDIL